ncbi:MAG: cyclic nucleotide-binding domain-containing protein [Kofleriaceae bacterium]|nr:cyclic nucleotide-binding domain-containing protein [Kofleriaceae bacterium]
MTKGSPPIGTDDSLSIEISIEEAGEDPGMPDPTPLPRAVPYHVVEPTTASVRQLVAEPEDLPISEGAATRPGSEDAVLPQMSGIASAARRISASLGVVDDDALPTGRLPRLDTEDEPTPPPRRVFGEDLDEELLLTPPMIVRRSAVSIEPTALPDASASLPLIETRFFEPLPEERRGAVLDRFVKRSVPAGTTVIRQGEAGHPLILVAQGRLDVRAELATGELVAVTTVGMGEFVGEAALLARTPAPAHVVALSDAELLLLSPRDLYELAGAFPALWAELKDVAERRTRELDRRVKKR